MLPCPVPAHPSPLASVSRVNVQELTASPTGRASRFPLSLLQPLSWMPPCHLATRLTALLWVPLALPLFTKSSLVLSLPKNHHGCWTMIHWPLGPITQAMLPLPPLGPAAGTSWVFHEAKALLASLALPVSKAQLGSSNGTSAYLGAPLCSLLGSTVGLLRWPQVPKL